MTENTRPRADALLTEAQYAADLKRRIAESMTGVCLLLDEFHRAGLFVNLSLSAVDRPDGTKVHSCGVEVVRKY